ncbi:MAG: VCBS repeat-containing protein [Saprospiraceae bacterium]|nr:VCBS repeat-containing protein [Saprospiraceae bacterium]
MHRERYLFLITISLAFWHCQSPSGPEDSARENKLIALQYCQSCHTFPSPDLLDKATWSKGVLPNMAARLGLIIDHYNPYENMDAAQQELVREMNVYPESPLISEDKWQAINDYYLSLAPEQLPLPTTTSEISPSPPPFDPNLINMGDKKIPQVSLLKYDPKKSILYVGDHLDLFALSSEGVVISTWKTQSPSVDIHTDQEEIYLLSIGEFSPSDKKNGVLFPLSSSHPDLLQNKLIMGLSRPVQFTIADLNGDKSEDVLICQFGNHQGGLVWFENMQSRIKHSLSELPGARKSIVKDLNKDGLDDIMVLMAQAWEKVVIYYNQGHGNFREETVLNFPPVYGVSYFELKDFNDDGYEDILLSNGDNWDYSPIKKPYHGIRIFLNDQTNHFTASYFYPMNGCSQATAVDFDQDGDLDIAAISFYNDQMDYVWESFVYLENTGNLNFIAHYMNETNCGKWLTMETGDFNQDGYPDIFLGSYFHNITELSKALYQGVQEFPQVLLLTYSAEN